MIYVFSTSAILRGLKLLNMIILPNTPPLATPYKGNLDIFSPSLNSQRASLCNASLETYNDLVRYVVNIEDYIESLFTFSSSKMTNECTIESLAEYASEFKLTLGVEIPWLNMKFTNLGGNNQLVSKSLSKLRDSKGDWYLLNEIESSLISASFIYIRLGVELVNELVEEVETVDNTASDISEKWKQVIEFYKKAISFVKLGGNISSQANGTQEHLNGSIFIFIEKIAGICIQMSILSKSSWINRNSFNEDETFKTTNNGTLCRVAIYILEELKSCKNLVCDMKSNNNYLVEMNTENWIEYLTIIEKYANAYAGLFLSIESYQQNKLGQAIGLLDYCLLSLQSKRVSDINSSKLKLVTNMKSKFANKKNESYIKNLESITTLNLKKSLFSEKSGIVLKDLSFLFDQLVLLHLKFTKQNDNLVFDKVTSFQDIQKDSKWPLGAKIPVSDIYAFSPRALLKGNESSKISRTRIYY